MMKASDVKPPPRGFMLIKPNGELEVRGNPPRLSDLLELVGEPTLIELGAAGVMAIDYRRGPGRLPFNDLATQYRRAHSPQFIYGGTVYGPAVLAARFSEPLIQALADMIDAQAAGEATE